MCRLTLTSQLWPPRPTCRPGRAATTSRAMYDQPESTSPIDASPDEQGCAQPHHDTPSRTNPSVPTAQPPLPPKLSIVNCQLSIRPQGAPLDITSTPRQTGFQIISISLGPHHHLTSSPTPDRFSLPCRHSLPQFEQPSCRSMRSWSNRSRPPDPAVI